MMETDKNLGSAAMLFVRDFNQLPPSQPESLALTLLQVAD